MRSYFQLLPWLQVFWLQMSITTTNLLPKLSALRCTLPIRNSCSILRQLTQLIATFHQVKSLSSSPCMRACSPLMRQMLQRGPQRCMTSLTKYTSLVYKTAVLSLSSMAHLRSTRLTTRLRSTNFWTMWTWHLVMWLWSIPSICMKRSLKLRIMIQSSNLRSLQNLIHIYMKG